MVRVLVWPALALLALVGQGPAFAAEVDQALQRAGDLQGEKKFAESIAVLAPFESQANGEVAFSLAFAHFNLAVDGKAAENIDQDGIQRAIHWAERARALGNAAGTNLLYMIHGSGHGVPVDTTRAFALLREAVEQGDPGARTNYAVMAYRGSPEVPRDRALAAEYFLELAKRDPPVPIALYYLGLIRYQGEAGQKKDEKGGMKLIRQAAEMDVGEAQQDVGRNHEYGWTGKADLGKALPWYEKAAAHGQPWSLWRIGMTYVHGEGREPDAGKAVEYFRRAIEVGSDDGMTSLAVMYATGEGVPQDLGEARRLYEQAADAGSDHALINLAGMYARGEGVEFDAVQAFVLITLAEQRGNEQAAELRKAEEKRLTPEELAEARRRLSER